MQKNNIFIWNSAVRNVFLQVSFGTLIRPKAFNTAWSFDRFLSSFPLTAGKKVQTCMWSRNVTLVLTDMETVKEICAPWFSVGEGRADRCWPYCAHVSAGQLNRTLSFGAGLLYHWPPKVWRSLEITVIASHYSKMSFHTVSSSPTLHSAHYVPNRFLCLFSAI